MIGRIEHDAVETGIVQPLLLSSEEKQQDDDGEEDCDEASKEIQKPVTSIVAAYRLLTPSVKVWK